MEPRGVLLGESLSVLPLDKAVSGLGTPAAAPSESLATLRSREPDRLWLVRPVRAFLSADMTGRWVAAVVVVVLVYQADQVACGRESGC